MQTLVIKGASYHVLCMIPSYYQVVLSILLMNFHQLLQGGDGNAGRDGVNGTTGEAVSKCHILESYVFRSKQYSLDVGIEFGKKSICNVLLTL